jgi:long-chain acyl-CoA synthetase
LRIAPFEHFPNLVAMFLQRADAGGDRPFLSWKEGGAWRHLSWAQTAQRVAALAEGLTALGLQRGDRVLLVSENRPEWAIADLAIMAAGGVTVPSYTSNTTRDHAHVAGDSGAHVAIVSTAKLAQTLIPALIDTDCRTLIAIEPIDAATMPLAIAEWAKSQTEYPGDAGQLEIIGWDDLLAQHEGDVAACAARADFAREDLACIIYTSGTGGNPRGVRQHHGALLHNVAGAYDILAGDFPRRDDERFLSLLPLSHAYEHTAGLHLPIGLAAEIWYSEGIDRLAANFEEAQPTIMVVVPRLFEMMRQRLLRSVEQQGRFASWLLAKAMEIGPGPRRLIDRPIDLLIELTLRRKIRARFGGRVKALVSGGAPLNVEVGRFFEALGLTVLQGYGQTECGPIATVNRPSAGNAIATVGPPLRDTEVRIAEDGEILVRGENVMHAYWRNETETARALVDGWLHTGDIGRFDDSGRLMITDRKKDLIVNDKGENVAPQRIEGMLQLEPEIAQAMVSGDKRPYLVGLIVPDRDWQRETKLEGPALHRALQAAVDRVNAGLSVTERVRRILVADQPFTIENKALTPSLKMRRHVLRERYGAELDALYKA